jgi:hypothetical protein
MSILINGIAKAFLPLQRRGPVLDQRDRLGIFLAPIARPVSVLREMLGERAQKE